MSHAKPFFTRQRTALIVLSVLTLVLIVGLINFIHHRMQYAMTNAVFVASDSLTEVGFDRVSGLLLELKKKAGDKVVKGEILARLDDRRYRMRLREFQAKLTAEQETRAALQLKRQRLAEEFRLQRRLVAREIERLGRQKQAQQARSKSLAAVIDQLQRDQKRLQNLYQQQVIARHQLETKETLLSSKQAEQQVNKRLQQGIDAAISAARIKKELAVSKQKQLAEIDRQLASIDQQVKRLQASRDDAELDLKATWLRSPLSGQVAKRFVGDHSNLAPGRPIYALVNPRDLYLIALLEENKLAGVSPGAAVNIRIDAYPKRSWHGEVEQILPASAATFALAPRDISAGEFTKVAQRIPVRIRITKGSLDKLRVGMGGEVDIRRQDG